MGMLPSSSSSSSSSSIFSSTFPVNSPNDFQRLSFSNFSFHNKPNSSTLLSCAAQKIDQKEAKLLGGGKEDSRKESLTPWRRLRSPFPLIRLCTSMISWGSRAHAEMLAHQGLITHSDRDQILGGLDQIEKQIERGDFTWRTDREDVHKNIEAALTDSVGEPAKKLHTARSRNDQVSTDFRLWCRDAINTIVARIKYLQEALVVLNRKNEGLIVPGYTHLQRAQPVLLPHLLLAYVEQLELDAGRLLDCRSRLNFFPLGACALAGTGLPIDRFMTSDALAFTAPMRNSIDAVSDRDFVLELLFSNSIMAVHLSRLGEEWVFGFLTPSDPVSTGSSIMPQKKNPDPMELVCGKSAMVVGDLVTLLILCKGLPHAYSRDLQEDEEAVFDSVKTIIGIQKALPAGHLDATTLADYLVNESYSFNY